MVPPYEVSEESVEQRTRVVAIRGELDMAAAPAFEERLLNCLSGETPVILDLSDVSFMDSTAIGALISVRKKANMTRGRFAVVVPPGDVERMLRITRLDTAFDIVPTRSEALARLTLA